MLLRLGTNRSISAGRAGYYRNKLIRLANIKQNVKTHQKYHLRLTEIEVSNSSSQT